MVAPRKAGLAAALLLAAGLSGSPLPAADGGAETEANTFTATIKWTAPGDDGWVGRATLYDLRYSSEPIDNVNFGKAFRLFSVPPKDAGLMQSFTVSGLDLNKDHYFAIKARDDSGNWSGLSNVLRVPARETSVDDPPVRLGFRRPWPNPARAQTRFAIDLPVADHVKIEAFDMSGRRVRTLADHGMAAGTTEVLWDLRHDDGRPLAAGVYLVRAQAGREAFLRRVSIIR